MNCTLRRIARSTVIAIAMLGGSNITVLADAPTDVRRVDNDQLHGASGIASLQWSEDTNRLHAACLNGDALSWIVTKSGNQPLQVISIDNHLQNSLATLMTIGPGGTILTGGLSATPSLNHLPGTLLGTLADTNLTMPAIAAYPHVASNTLAILARDRILIYSGQDLRLTMNLPGRFDFLSWFTSSSPTPVRWLAAYSPTDGTITIWNTNTATNWSKEVILLPRFSDQSNPAVLTPLELTCISSQNTDGNFVTGDARGMLRFWNPSTKDSMALTQASASQLSRDGATLVEQTAKQLRLLHPFSGQDPTTLTTTEEGATAVAYAQQAAQDWVAVAWPTNEVELRQFGTSTSVTVTSNPLPTAPLRSLAINPKSVQVAGAGPNQKVLFFQEAPSGAQPGPVGGLEDDEKVSQLCYSSNGRWLYAVGQSLSLYDANQRQLIASVALQTSGMPSIAAADLLLEDATGDAPPARALLAYGDSSGKISICRVTTSSTTTPSITVAPIASQQTTSSPFRSIVLGDKRLVSVTEQDAVAWQLDESQAAAAQFVPLQRIEIADVQGAGWQSPKKAVVFRSKTEIKQQTLSAGSMYYCASEPLAKLAYKAPDLYVAGTKSGSMFQLKSAGITQITNATPPFNAITELAFDPTGARLLGGVKQGTAFQLRQWSVSDIGVQASSELFTTAQPIESLLFGETSETLALSQQDGELLLLNAANDAGAKLVMPMSAGLGASKHLSWLPKENLQESDFDRMLIIRNDGSIIQTCMKTNPGPRARFSGTAAPYRSPWYAGAIAPGQRETAFVNAAGEVWHLDWPFARLLNGFQVDNSDIVVTPAATTHPSQQPLYALTWSSSSAPASPPSLTVAGADATFYRRAAGMWTHFASITDQPIYCLSAHSQTGIIAAGHGPSPEKSGIPPQWLSVWSNDFSQHIEWSGHLAPVVALAFSHNGNWLASVDQAHRLIVWDSRNAAPNRLNAPANKVIDLPNVRPMSLSWIAKNNLELLAVGLSDGRVLLFEVVSH